MNRLFYFVGLVACVLIVPAYSCEQPDPKSSDSSEFGLRANEALPAQKDKKITREEVEQDHKIILRYIRLNISQQTPKEQEWKGPWSAEHDSNTGKLYRLRYVVTIIGSDFARHDKK